ncbi:hypothetical protein PHET_10089 [Paragonimus heterotremus]|uniref:CUB domain-containing protein n=1 Tax=Paragonimus heterotremus TaxID=100268 RepID=A0A8J4T2M1_9TREM|nr:hypothetical protein PHET_10089 [Paragonimus heterotremus]
MRAMGIVGFFVYLAILIPLSTGKQGKGCHRHYREGVWEFESISHPKKSLGFSFCMWSFETSPDKRISITFDSLDILSKKNPFIYDSLVIFDGSDCMSPSSELPPKSTIRNVVSTKNHITIMFYSGYKGKFPGFRVDYLPRDLPSKLY